MVRCITWQHPFAIAIPTPSTGLPFPRSPPLWQVGKALQDALGPLFEGSAAGEGGDTSAGPPAAAARALPAAALLKKAGAAGSSSSGSGGGGGGGGEGRSRLSVTSAAQLADLLLVKAAVGVSSDPSTTTGSSTSSSNAGGTLQRQAAGLAYVMASGVTSRLPSAAQAAWCVPRLLLLTSCEASQPLLTTQLVPEVSSEAMSGGSEPGSGLAAAAAWQAAAAAGCFKPSIASSSGRAVASLKALQKWLGPGESGAAWVAAGCTAVAGQAAGGGVQEEWDPVQEVLKGFRA
jgi:hypothetical protein